MITWFTGKCRKHCHDDQTAWEDLPHYWPSVHGSHLSGCHTKQSILSLWEYKSAKIKETNGIKPPMLWFNWMAPAGIILCMRPSNERWLNILCMCKMIPALRDVVTLLQVYFLICFTNSYLEHFLWNWSEVGATVPNWWQVPLLQSGSKSLSEWIH